ncbi:MAG: 50S ribosomal protein L10, partial [Patescibacteria group bacterium]
DFTKIAAEDMRRLRRELASAGGKFLVIKKRLLELMLKEKGLDFEAKQFKTSLGTVFAPEVEKSAGSLFQFFKKLGVEKEKMLGGYDVAGKTFMDADKVKMIGALPPREVLLAQLASMIAAPIRSLLYIMKEKSQRS